MLRCILCGVCLYGVTPSVLFGMLGVLRCISCGVSCFRGGHLIGGRLVIGLISL